MVSQLEQHIVPIGAARKVRLLRAGALTTGLVSVAGVIQSARMGVFDSTPHDNASFANPFDRSPAPDGMALGAIAGLAGAVGASGYAEAIEAEEEEKKKKKKTQGGDEPPEGGRGRS
jgi:hypothetical protein